MRVGIDVLACRKLAKRHMRIEMSHKEPYWCQLPLKKKNLYPKSGDHRAPGPLGLEGSLSQV